METLTCLRCEGQALSLSPPGGDDIQFFECPACQRSYAKPTNGPLTYRWRHPVSLPLYCVLFEDNPVSASERIARSFVKDEPAAELAAIVDEIELELDAPTQNVRDILDHRQSEEQLRAFLREFVAHVRRAM